MKEKEKGYFMKIRSNNNAFFLFAAALLLLSLSACSSVEKSDKKQSLTEEEKWAESIRSSYKNWEPEKNKEETFFEELPVTEQTDVPEQTQLQQTAMPSPMQSSAAKKKLPSAVHTVVRGETLWGIARKYYGKGIRWKEIASGNAERLKKGTVINPGLVLVIPSVTDEEVEESAVEKKDSPDKPGEKGTDVPDNSKKEIKADSKETRESDTGKKK